MSDRLPIPSSDELSIPLLISYPGDNAPMVEQWKRDHPDWFVAGTYEPPPETRIDPNGPQRTSDIGPFERSIAPIIPRRPRNLRPTAKNVGVPPQPVTIPISATLDRNAPAAPKANDDPPIHDARHARRRPPVTVVLPDGSTVEQVERNGRRGPMVSPFADLSDVAAAGRAAGEVYRAEMQQDLDLATSLRHFEMALDIAHGGRFDYQRDGSGLLAYTFGLAKRNYAAYVPVSNFNVGLWCQQAGMSLEEMLATAGMYAPAMSNNKGVRDRYGLVSEQAEMTEKGWRAGASGLFNTPNQ